MSLPILRDSVAPHFAEMVVAELSDKYSSKKGGYEKDGYEKVMRSGYQVTTTLDIDMQNTLKDNINKQMRHINRMGGSNASGVVVDPTTGEVRALVGSADYNNEKWGKVNMVTRNAVDLAAARQGFGGTDNLLHRPIAAFHQNIRLDFGNQRGGRVAVEPGDPIHAGQRRR